MNVLVRFYWDCGRMGDIDGLFVCTREEYDNAIGRHVYLGEVLGKYSEVEGVIDAESLTIISEEQGKIDWLTGIMESKTISGYNPIDYIKCGRCGEHKEFCDCEEGFSWEEIDED